MYPNKTTDCIVMEDKDKICGDGFTLAQNIRSHTHSLKGDFDIFLDVDSVPLNKTLSYLPAGILGLCIEGSITIDVYLYEHHITKGELIVILPDQLIAIKDKSDDFKMNYFSISNSLIHDVLSGISRLSPLFFIHMRRKHHYKLTNEEIYRFTEYYHLVDRRFKNKDSLFQREYIVNLLRLFYLDIYSNYKNTFLTINASSETRKEKLTYDFFILIMEHFRENREIAFYAEKLCITPKYLSAVVKEVSGRLAKDWIVEYTILEIESLLKNPAFNIQEITIKTNFSNQASLGRFFRKHTGMSPSEYRMKK